jgi:hypothetical protein
MYYAFIDAPNPTPLLPLRVNGGLYTGEPAKGPWGNVPVVPSQYGLSQNLLSANPPPNAEKLYMDPPRPGNNPDERDHYYVEYNEKTNPGLKCLK